MSINRHLGEGNVVCPHSGHYSAAKGMNYRSRSISQKHFAEQRKPDTEEHIPYDSGRGREGQSVVLRFTPPNLGRSDQGTVVSASAGSRGAQEPGCWWRLEGAAVHFASLSAAWESSIPPCSHHHLVLSVF